MDYRDYPEYHNAMMRNDEYERYKRDRERKELLHYYERDCDRYGVPDLVGYKVLVGRGRFFESPALPVRWVDEKLIANEIPSEYNFAGIYVAKYIEDALGYLSFPQARMFIVGMKPRIVEHERGYRAYKAYIIQEVVV